MKVHSLTAGDFRSLAAGYGSPAALAVLTASQVTKRRLQIRAIADVGTRTGSNVGPVIATALALLQEVEATRPDAVRTVLAHPFLDVWAADLLPALSNLGAGAGPSERARVVADAGHLSALAAAAAARAGLRFHIAVPCRDGTLVLPTVGAVRGLENSPVEVHGDGSALTFEAGGRSIWVGSPYTDESRPWAPQRYLTAVAPGGSHVVAIEDLDPYRDCCQWRPMDRLTGADAERMRRLYHDAWGLLVRDYPEHATGLRATLRSLVPLTTTRPDRTVSATSSRAFGSLGVSLPEDPATLALLLVHEFQHMKLSALLDLVDLCRVDGPARHFAPWRADPRPAAALLQGVYAHVGVTDFWRRRRLATAGRAMRLAEFEFAHWRSQTASAIGSLQRSGELTHMGVRFVSHLAQTLSSWQAELVPPAAEAAAADVGLAKTVRWRISHWRPSTSDLRRLAAAVRTAHPCPPVAAAVFSPAHQPASTAELAALIRTQAMGGALPAGMRPADVSYLAGKYGDALPGYTTLIEQGEPDGWVGLALVLRRLRWAGAEALAHRPDVLHQLYAATGGAVAPVQLAAWLEPGLPLD